MKKLIAVASILFSISCASQAATYPYQPTPVSKFVSDGEKSENLTRLRLSVSLDEGTADESIRIGDLIFCSSSACYRPPVNNYISVKSTVKGDATVVFDSFVPPDVIKTIYFNDVAGAKVIVGKIELSEPLKLEKGFQGGDIMVLLKKAKMGKATQYTPVQAVSALMDSEAQAVYYNPNFSSTVSLPLGVTLSMPAGALAKPQIFSIAVRDTGNAYPAVDVFPYLNTQKEFTVSAAPQPMSRSGEATPAAAMPTADAQGQSAALTVRRPITKKFTRTANLKLSQAETESTIRHPDFVFNPYATECSDLLKRGGALSAVEKVIGYSGAVTINWCEDKYPAVHIAVINHDDARVFASMAYSQKFPELMNLTRITDRKFQDRAIFAINGFYWDGDLGTGPNQTGKPSGYVESQGNQMGTNHNRGVSQGNKRIFAARSLVNMERDWLDRAGIWKANSRFSFVVSSSTSVVRDGICSNNTERNRFSAIGETNGRIVLVSSTSDGEADTQTLCGIFQAMDIKNAIRLDGGPSTAMTVDKVLKNPITGLARFKYGSLRYIPYALKFGH